MKTQYRKRIAIIGTVASLWVGNAHAGLLPTPDWGNLEGFLALPYFPGQEIRINPFDFTGTWIYTAIGRESGNTNIVEEPLSGTPGVDGASSGTTFTTGNYSNWGQWNTVNFSVTNLFFEDNDGPYNIQLDPLTTTSDPGFKLYQLVSDSLTLDYLSNKITLKKGDYVLGFNDNFAKSSDADYDDIIVAMRPVPEPTTMLLFGAGLAGLAAMGRKRKVGSSKAE